MQYKLINNNTAAEILFYGSISQFWISADDYAKTIEEIKSKGIKNVLIRTHCYGGGVLEGSAIWTTNKTSGLDIKFRVEGVAASTMGIVIFSGTSVEMSSLAKVMLHAPIFTGGGTSKQLFENGKLLKAMEKDFAKVWASKTGVSEAEAMNLMDGTDYWFSADDMVAKGLATIIPETAFVTNNIAKPDAGTTAQAIYEQYTAFNNSINNLKTNFMDKGKLIASLGLTGVTADSTDEQVMAAIEAKKQADTQAAAQVAKAQVTAQATALIDAREKELNTQFTAEQKTAFIETAVTAGNCDSLKVLLGVSVAAPRITSMLGTDIKGTPVAGLPADRANWTFADWQEKDSAGLEAMEKNNIEAFKKLYNAQYSNNKASFG